MEWGPYIMQCERERSTYSEGSKAEGIVQRQEARMGIVSLLPSWEGESSWFKAVRAKLGVYYAQYGRFCACHPWEIIVSFVTLTVCVLSMSFISGGKVAIPCGEGDGCQEVPHSLKHDDKPTDGMDAVAMTIINCVAVVYVYTQFKSLSKTGSKYILGTSGLFVIFSSFIFGIGATFYLLERNMTIISEVVPFFLLLTDLSKATKLAKFAMNSENKEEVQENIGRALALLGPSLTLDTLVTALAVGVGVMSGVPKLELICCFGCVTIISNFVVFITFFPASLALALEVCPSNPAWRLDEFARAMQEEQEKKPNPVVQRVKLIMSLGLVAIHLHSHGGFFTKVTGIPFGTEFANGESSEWAVGSKMELVPFHQFLWLKLLHLTLGQVVTLTLGVALIVKYILFDKPAKAALKGPKKTRFANGKSKDNEEEEDVDFVAPSGCLKNWDRSSMQGLYRETVSRGGWEDTVKQRDGVELDQHVVTSEDLFPGATEEDTAPPAKEDSEEPPSTAHFTVGSAPASRRSSIALALDSEQVERVSEDLKETLSGAIEDIPEGEREMGEEGREGVCPRSVDLCSSLLAAGRATELSDDEVIRLVQTKRLPAYKLESSLDDPERGVSIRRRLLCQDEAVGSSLDELPYSGYDYSKVMGACCENVIGYMPVPVGVAGPLLLDGQQYHVPMATTEGCLVASTNRGCRALASAGGVSSFVVSDGMTRGPVVRLPSAAESTALKLWLDSPENHAFLHDCFSRSSRFAHFQSVSVAVAGRLAYIRFKVKTGDAMGMNMISKGAEYALKRIQERHFPSMEIISLSGNFCVDKKPSAINWIEGRGKSVVCEAVVPSRIVKQVLKTEVEALVELNTCKNLVGSAMAGSVGGFNAHAANIVTAIYIATGQDPAQNVGSSNCLTLMEPCGHDGADLRVSCTMPSIEVGTVGGGTFLPAQSACLQLLRVQGPHQEDPGTNATNLARIVCGAVLAGELSLMSALAAGHLVKSHMTHNRSRTSLGSIPELPFSHSEPHQLPQASLASTEEKSTDTQT